MDIFIFLLVIAGIVVRFVKSAGGGKSAPGAPMGRGRAEDAASGQSRLDENYSDVRDVRPAEREALRPTVYVPVSRGRETAAQMGAEGAPGFRRSGDGHRH